MQAPDLMVLADEASAHHLIVTAVPLTLTMSMPPWAPTVS
jgi:hypothetical protein